MLIFIGIFYLLWYNVYWTIDDSIARRNLIFMNKNLYDISDDDNNSLKNKSSASLAFDVFWAFIKFCTRLFLIGSIILGCIAVGLLSGIVAGCIITTKPLTKDDLSISEFTSYIYDASGNVMCQLKGSDNVNRVWIDIDEVPEDFTDAVVSIEDERFYSHNGIDMKRSISAFMGYFIPGMGTHGGSTLTQQVVKNVTGDDENSVPRKVREQWRAYQLEKDYSKKEILEIYINVIYMAQDVYGIEAAANAYFSKDARDLSLAECAFLAGISNSPTRYNPLTTTGRANAYKRQIIILDKMLELGKITDEEYIQAIQTELIFNDDYKIDSTKASKYSYFAEKVITDVRNDLIEAGYTYTQATNIIFNTGINIFSTQNTDIQNIVTEEYCNKNNFPVNSSVTSSNDQAQSAIVIMDQYNGTILAMYGGYGEKTSQWPLNRATDIERQPGSSIKPILVYAPLIDMGKITADSTINDTAVKLDKNNPDELWPQNSDKTYHGVVSARQALVHSFNVPAVLFYKDNVTQCLEYLKKCGIDRTSETQLAAALGGLTIGVSPLEMTAAYVTLANNGTYYKPASYSSVYDRNHNLLLSNVPETTLVYNKATTSHTMTTILEDVLKYGTATDIDIVNKSGEIIPTAGKTGTTTSKHDYWFCGYTGYYTAAVWYGYDNQKEITDSENGAAKKIWEAIMLRLHSDLEPKEFVAPN